MKQAMLNVPKMKNTSALFSSVQLGPYTLKNRIVMPPLTRSRSTQPDNIPNDLMASYYAQRASAGFMVTEGTQMSRVAKATRGRPGFIHQRKLKAGKKSRKQYMLKAVLFLRSCGTLAACLIPAYNPIKRSLSLHLPLLPLTSKCLLRQVQARAL